MRQDTPRAAQESRAREGDQRKRASSRFEAWTRGGLTGISTLRVAPPWIFALAVAFIIALVVGFGALRSGPLRGGLVFVGLWGVVLISLRTWLIATARTRNYLVTRTDWSDMARLGMIAAVVVLAPILAGAVAYVGITLLGMLDR